MKVKHFAVIAKGFTVNSVVLVKICELLFSFIGVLLASDATPMLPTHSGN